MPALAALAVEVAAAVVVVMVSSDVVLVPDGIVAVATVGLAVQDSSSLTYTK